MSQTPFVSVIVPNYNYARFLRQRIDSILQQTYSHLELIILDDCSTDNSMEVISQYADNPHVSQIVRNEQNTGSPIKQWMKGISLAKGDIVWLAEADDYCEPDFLSTLVNLYVANNCVLCFSRSMWVDNDGKEIGICQNKLFHQDEVSDGKKFIKKYLTLGNRVANASSAIFSRDVALNIDRQFTDYRQSGDWLFWIEIAQQGNVAVVSKPLNFFRRSFTATSKAILNGTNDIEDYKVLSYLEAQRLGSIFTIFNKRKRLAGNVLYNKRGRYKDEPTRLKVYKLCPLPKYYYFIARLSHLFHVIFR